MEEVLSLVYTYWHVLLRRRWLAISVAWVVSVVVWTGVAVLPDQYESKAQIYVDTTTLLGPLLKGIAVQGNINQQLQVMERTLFSRPNLEKVARDNDLDLLVETDDDKELLLQDVEKRASIKAGGHNLFIVSFTDKNPLLAKDVTQSFLDIFVSTNIGQNRKGMENARTFIESQISKYEKQLAAAERRVAEFKSRHADILAQGAFFGRYERLSQEYALAVREREDQEIVRKQLIKQIEDTPKMIPVDVPVERNRDIKKLRDNDPLADVRIDHSARKQLSRSRDQLEDMKLQLAGMLSNFTENHPDVLGIRRQIAEVEARIEVEEEDAKAEEQAEDEAIERAYEEAEAAIADGTLPPLTKKTMVANSIHEQLQIKLLDLDQELVRIRKNEERTRALYDDVKEQKASAPAIEAELTALDRDYSVIKSQYEELLERREAASISAAREASTDAVQFRIVEPPEIPALPVRPNRILLSIGGLFLGIGAGVAVPILLAMLSGVIYSRRDLENTFNIQVLGSVGYISGAAASAGKLVNNLMTFGVIATLLGVFAGTIIVQPSPEMVMEALEFYGFQGLIERIIGKVSGVILGVF